MIQDVFARSDMPTYVRIREQAGPAHAAAADKQPDEDRQEKEVRQRWNQQPGPSVLKHRLNAARRGRTVGSVWVGVILLSDELGIG